MKPGTSPFAALKHGNFRIFLTGQCFSLVGVWMQRMAMSWLVLRTTDSVGNVGLIELLNQAPVFIVGLFSGVVLDRFNTRTVLWITQALILLQSIALTFLVHSGEIEFGHLIAISLFLGIVNSLDQPARQACVPQTIDGKDLLPSALSLNSVVFNLARILGPSLAGFVIHKWGEGGCFAVNSAAFLAALGLIAMLRLPKRDIDAERTPVWNSIRDGVSYIAHTRVIVTMLIVFFMFNFSCVPYVVLLPAYAKNVLHGTSQLLGVFLGAIGVGSIFGVIILAVCVPLRRITAYMGCALLVSGCAFFAFSYSRNIPLSIACLVAFGFGSTSAAVANNTLIQALVSERYRGRVMSFFVMGTMGFGPIGSLCVGHIADAFSEHAAAVFCAACAFATGALLLKLRKGMTPEVDAILRERGL